MLVTVLAVCASDVMAAKGKNEEPVVLAPLAENGQKLEAKYAGQLKILQEQIKMALPQIDAQKMTEFTALYQAESSAWQADLSTLRAAGKKGAPETAVEARVKAVEALAAATTNALAPSKAMMEELKGLLESDKLDGMLAKCFIMSHATPRGLAEYAQQGKEQEERIEKLLKDEALMFQIAVADGAGGGRYGKAMEVYEAIQKASEKARDGVLQRLALGTALEHATPVGQTNPENQPDAPATVDPVKRYLHFEKAYLDGELDAGFKDLSVWDYRMVGNGNENEEVLAWGREMLRNYRPDHISNTDYKWRYVEAVKTDVRYGSDYNKFDRPDLHTFQNMIMNGGVCGRRAFFGRFILRAFGIPVTARPQPGHAALAHWTPNAWVVCLGAGWQWGSTSLGEGVDFDAHTRGRLAGKPFEQVRRAQMIGTALGEAYTFGFHAAQSGFWNGVALYTQRRIAEEANSVSLGAVGTDIGEANESKEKEVVREVVLTDEEKAVVVDNDGVITIPAVACTFGTNSPGKILFMESSLGGKQMHYNRNGAQLDFEYTFDAPKDGKYEITARVVTVSPDQLLLASVNGAADPMEVKLPFTVGMWASSEPVIIELSKGKNVLKFSRGGDNIRGVSIKDFTLKPKG